MKLAFADALALRGRPRPGRRARRAACSTRSTRRAPRRLIGNQALLPGARQPPRGGTVYLCAADSDGMMVSYIQSNYMGFGSRRRRAGHGHRPAEPRPRLPPGPGHPNQLAPRQAALPHDHPRLPDPRRRRRSGPFGVMGGYMQPQGHMQMIVNTVDYGMNPQASLDAPRWQWTSGRTVLLEDEVPVPDPRGAGPARPRHQYFGQPEFQHGEVPAVGILLANLGTPDAPDTPALRRYLREFLLDPRVIEMPRVLWRLILHLCAPLPAGKSAALSGRSGPRRARPSSSSATPSRGAPAGAAARDRHAGPRRGRHALRQSVGPRGAARAGRQGVPPDPGAAALPAVRGGDHRLDDRRRGRRADHLALGAGDPHDPSLPRRPGLHPGAGGEHPRALGAGEGRRRSSSSPSTASRSATSWPATPTSASATSSPAWPPRSWGFPRERWQVSFQSLFGKEEWLRPYTNQTITALAKSGLRQLDVVCPGFSADCLETIEEIDQENREVFLHAGGERYRYIPALNDRPDRIRAIAELVHRNLQGWVKTPAEWSEEGGAPGRRRVQAAGRGDAVRTRFYKTDTPPAGAGFGTFPLL